MQSNLMQMIYLIFLPKLEILLFLGGVFSLIVGIGLIFRSDVTLGFFEKMNRWVSSRSAMREVEIPRNGWPFILRYRYVLGGFITVGAVYATIGLMTQVYMGVLIFNMSNALHLPLLFVSWILHSLYWFLILGCALSIVIGLMLVFFINPLSRLETLSGKWISTRNNVIGRGASFMHIKLDKMVMSSSKIAGWIITVMSLIDIILIVTLLFL